MIALALMMLAAAPADATATARVEFDVHHFVRREAAGLADRRTGRAVTIDDPVRIASVSKLFVALGVMRLVEAGTLDLDGDVSDVLGWWVRNPAFPEAPVTLRQLLSHTSGLRDDAGYAITLGGTVQATLADPKAWDGQHAPGRWFHYSNLNFPVVASVMEAATRERFDALMKRIVIAPLRLRACFNWTTCGRRQIARAVVLYDSVGQVVRDDLQGARPACPVLIEGACDLAGYRPGTNGALFSPQGGLRISAADLARVGRMLIRNRGTFLTPASIDRITTPVWTFDGTNGDTEQGFYCTYGLGVQIVATPVGGCHDDPFGDGRRRLGHAGEAYGVRSGLWIDRGARTGVAYFATAVPDDAVKGDSAFTAIEERLAGRQNGREQR